MADFNKAFDITMKHEGGYANNPFDVGGETYRGISRRYHPHWIGWSTVDKIKEDHKNGASLKLTDKINTDTMLPLYIQGFYRTNFWDPFWGDEIYNQNLANELFDTAVNMGMHRAITFLQTALNVLNRNTELWADIVEDGIFGPKTLTTANAPRVSTYMEEVLKVMNILQGMHYINFMKKSPEQERFARGWLKRVYITKEVV